MPARAQRIAIGPLRLSPLAFGLVVSVAAHGALLLALDHLAWREKLGRAPAVMFSLGEPVRVTELALMEVTDLVEPSASLEVDADRPGPPVEEIAQPAAPMAPSRRRAEAGGTRGAGSPALLPRPAGEARLVFLRPWVDPDPQAPGAPAADSPAPDQPPEAPGRRSQPSAATPSGVSRGASAPDLRSPVYPITCRQRGHEGLVRIRATIRADGSVAHAEAVTRDACPRLVASALAAVRESRFRPALRDGRPITARVVIPFRFHLRVDD